LDANGARECATVTETASKTVPIEVDLEHPYAAAKAHTQLTWILPGGGSTPTIIPTLVFTPGPPVSATSPAGTQGSAKSGTQSGTQSGTKVGLIGTLLGGLGSVLKAL
jgi:hypothetical protein